MPHSERILARLGAAAGAAIFCSVLAGGSFAAVVTYQPVADTEVRADIPTVNFGNATAMGLDGDPLRIALMRFDVSVPPGEEVRSASLRLFVSASHPAGIFINQVASTTWGETTTNFNNAPAVGAQVAASGPLTANIYVSIDVTPAITGSGLVSLAVTRADTVPLAVNSREAAADRQPQLVLETGPAGPPPAIPPTVTADGLPTWQINGVVWSQVIVNNIVYATGSFTRARPPGVAAGGPGEVDAQNIFAYDITTGERVAAFNHSLNAQGLVIAAAPDGSRVYVGGDFTAVDGFARGHVAAFRTDNGALDQSFAPNVEGQVLGLAVSNTTVYVGGAFGRAGGQTRGSLAAFNAADGALLPWAPAIDNGQYSKVWTMVLSPDRSRVIVGGSFRQINGTSAYGMGSVDAATGAVRPWAANQTIRDAGRDGAIYSLRADANQIYGTGYSFGSRSETNFEGSFAADPLTGSITLVNDCLGDTYDVLPMRHVLYSVGHAHDCRSVGGFPDTSPRVRWQRALAQTIAPQTVNTGPNAYGWNYAGLPASSMLQWFPQLAAGSYTGMSQAAFSLAGNGSYVSLGGEFPRVNGVAQQGLVRMAVRSIAPNKVGPTYSTNPPRPIPATTASSVGSGSVRVTFGTAWDYDDRTLRYDVFRNGGFIAHTTEIATNFWTLPTPSFTDNGLAAGSSVSYQVRISDPDGNVQWSLKSNTVTVCCGFGLVASDEGLPSPLRLSDAISGETDTARAKRIYLDPLADRKYRPIRRDGRVFKSRIPTSPSALKAASAVRYSDRVTVRLAQVARGKEAAGQGRGAFPGRPNTALTFTIVNHSPNSIDLNQVVVAARYGAPARLASAVYNHAPARDFSGVLRPGKSATATYVFALPNRARRVEAIVDFDNRHAPAHFIGPKN